MATRRGNGEGSIRQRTDGRWQGRVMIAGRTHEVYGKTRREVQGKLQELRVNASKGIVPVTDQYTLADFAARWLADVARHNVRPATYRNYSDLMRLYVLPSLGAVKLTKLRPEHLQRLYSQLLEHGRMDGGKPTGRPLSAKTVKTAHVCLHTALEQAVKWNLVPRNVAAIAEPPRVKRREMQSLTAEQVRAVLAAAGSGRLGTLIDVAVNTGMRQGELLGLRWADVDLDTGILRVRLQYGRDGGFAEPKSARSRRTIDLPASTLATLREHKHRQLQERLMTGPDWEDQGLIFSTYQGRPMGHRNVERDFTALLERAGLPHVPFHALRHTHATLLLSAGVPVGDVSARLGHSSAAMTLDVYGHVLPDAGRGIAARMDVLLAR